MRHEAPRRGPVRLVPGAAGAAVENAAGGAAEQAADLAIPHDPAGRRVPVIALAERVLVVGAAEIVVQAEQRQHDDDDAAMAVHDRLGQAGGAAGIDDPERVIERQPHRLERVDRGARPCGDVGEQGVRCGRSCGVAVQNHMLDARQRSPQLGDDVLAIMPASGIGDGVAGDQHLWLDLLEAVDHGGRGHVGRADAPDRADAGAGEKRNDGFGDVRQIGRDTVAGLDALVLQMQRERGRLALELRPAGLAELAVLAAADDRGQAGGMRGVDMPEHLPCVVHLRARKPDRARHLALGDDGRKRRRRLQIVIVPDAAPEPVEIAHRPLPHLLVIREGEAALRGEPVAVEGDLGDEGSGHWV
ncbi:hypothetical protein ABID58_004317 [Bradyrhizobium sp. S3.2.6]